MGRAPCCDKANVKKGPWSPEEDRKLKDYIEKHGTGGNWIALPHKAGLRRCGKSCRLRWLNYLRPNIKHGDFSDDEDRIICSLFASIGSRWSIIAAQLPGRTDNDIKNYFNTKLKKKLLGFPPPHRKPQQQQQHHHHHHHHHQQQQQQVQQQQQQQLFCSAIENSTTPFSLPQGIEAIVHPTTTTTLQRDPLHNLLMFGGDQQSCSSSDGSCNLLNYGRDLVPWEQLGLGSYLFGGGLEETQKVIPPVEYNNFDEIKEEEMVVGPSIGCNGLYPGEPSSASFERQGRSMYYY